NLSRERAESVVKFLIQKETMMGVMSIVSVIFGLAFTALYGWIIWKLRSPKIINEFKSVEHLNI
ncbi:MAG: hypothetical protein P8Y43_04660, partial [Sulfurovaceae bacterium]